MLIDDKDVLFKALELLESDYGEAKERLCFVARAKHTKGDLDKAVKRLEQAYERLIKAKVDVVLPYVKDYE